jgi:phosphomevalonate kinase
MLLNEMQPYDVVIIGGGVSGLCAAYTFTRTPSIKVLVIDKGSPPDRRASERDDPDRVAYGAGGAGIVNDGKFTAGLAGTHLRPMPGYDAALEEVAALIGCDVADLLPDSASEADTDTDWHVKKSKSVQLPLAERLALVQRLVDVCVKAGNIEFWWERELKFISYPIGGLTSLIVDDGETYHMPTAVRIILATGRFWTSGNMFPASLSERIATFRRMEVGVRLDMPPALLRRVTQWTSEVKDPKWTHKFTHKGIEAEARTFCTCDNGEVIRVAIPGDHGIAVSGVSDVEPTGRSNVGITVRVCSADNDLELPSMHHTVHHTSLLSLGKGELALQLSPPEMRWLEMILVAIKAFLAGAVLDSTDLQTDIALHFWAIEGVGEYPRVTPTDPFVSGWPEMAVCGDASGIYRGLVQAMVSGICVAQQTIAKYMRGTPSFSLPTLAHKYDGPQLTCEGKTHIKTVLYESHVFLGPLNPPPDVCERYRQCVDMWNKYHAGDRKKMKAPVIGLCVRGAEGTTSYVHVMQSSRYITDAATTQDAVNALAEDRLFWEMCGFEILRCKLEASTPTVSNLGYTLDPALYFETHLKVVPLGAVADGNQKTTRLPLPTPDNLAALADVTKRLSNQFGVPVCLSYNAAKDPQLLAAVSEQGWAEYDALSHGQRFVNFRMRQVSPAQDLQRCQQITDALRDEGWDVIAAIREVVVYQTSQLGDLGWLDPQASTVVLVSGKRFAGKSTFVRALRSELRTQGVAVHEVRMSAPLKEAYCKRYMLDPRVLQDRDRSRKEAHRARMQAMTDELRAGHPHRFCWPALTRIAELNESTSGVIVVSDMRYVDDLDTMYDACCELVGKRRVFTARLDASDAERVARGCTPNSFVDQHESETDLDNLAAKTWLPNRTWRSWDFERRAGGPSTAEFARDVVNELLPKLWL